MASTRIQHLERIRTFITRSLKCISIPTTDQMTAFRRSIAFLDFATLEASATQSFADGLSCVSSGSFIYQARFPLRYWANRNGSQLYSFLSHVGLVPPPYQAMPYSTPSMRYSLRMRPFLSISLPEVPSFPEFTSLVSLRTPEKNQKQPTRSGTASQTEIKDQAHSILEITDQALKIARNEWEAISKANPDTARCTGCEDWWRISVKNVLRSCITANIMVATAKRALANVGSRSAQDALSVEIPESGKGYNPWWVVPQITAKPGTHSSS